MSKTYSAGIVTAYGAAKRAGYTGTYEDFCRQQAGYAENTQAVEQAKTDAVNAKNDAITAKNTAVSAKNVAVSAKDDAVSAKNTAVSAKDDAVSAKNTATTKAQEASTSATSAAQSASDAQGVLDSIPADYSDLSANVSQLQADLAYVPNRPVRSAEQLISDKRTVDKVPYKYRASQSGKSDRAYDMIVGGTVCFNQLAKDIKDTYTLNGVTLTKTDSASGTITGTATANSSLQLSDKVIPIAKDHVYLVPIIDGFTGTNKNKVTMSGFSLSGYNGGVFKSPQDYSGLYLRIDFYSGCVFNVTNYKHQIFDLTQMFGTTIADHIYALEQATAGAGVALFRAMFADDYYPYNVGGLVSVEGMSAHVMRDADDNIIGSYPLDSSLTLRGVPVLKDGKIEFDGDIYEADGTVTRRYAERVYQSGDESLANAITDGINTVYKLSEETTETAIPYASPQIVAPYGTEEYISETVCPVGHVTEYPDNLRAKIDGLPWDLSMIAPVEIEYTATRNYTTGQLLIVDNTLYKVTENIANNGTITPNSNVVATTLSEVIASLS